MHCIHSIQHWLGLSQLQCHYRHFTYFQSAICLYQYGSILENVSSGTECSVQPAQFKKTITSPASWLPRTLVIGWPQGGLSFSLPASCVCVLNWATMAGKVDASCQTTMPRHCVDLGWIPVHWVSDLSTRLDLLINVLIAYSNLLFRLTVDTANLHMIKC